MDVVPDLPRTVTFLFNLCIFRVQHSFSDRDVVFGGTVVNEECWASELFWSQFYPKQLCDLLTHFPEAPILTLITKKVAIQRAKHWKIILKNKGSEESNQGQENEQFLLLSNTMMFSKLRSIDTLSVCAQKKWCVTIGESKRLLKIRY